MMERRPGLSDKIVDVLCNSAPAFSRFSDVELFLKAWKTLFDKLSSLNGGHPLNFSPLFSYLGFSSRILDWKDHRGFFETCFDLFALFDRHGVGIIDSRVLIPLLESCPSTSLPSLYNFVTSSLSTDPSGTRWQQHLYDGISLRMSDDYMKIFEKCVDLRINFHNENTPENQVEAHERNR